MLYLDPKKAKPFDPDWISPGKQEALYNQRMLISVIGLAAILLPPAVYLVDQYAPDPCFRNSLSHYYYSQRAGVVFVMTLAFVGTLLAVYRAEAPHVQRLARVAGIAGLFVAVFPTEGPGCSTDPFNARMFGTVNSAIPDVTFDKAFTLFPGVGEIHYVAAAILFVIMFYFCAVVFRRSSNADIDPQTGQLRPVKRLRNGLYTICALVIAVSMIVMGLSKFDSIMHVFPARTLFWGEAVALMAFGIAWLVKGRAFNTALRS